jgi:uncharacterized membrane protein
MTQDNVPSMASSMSRSALRQAAERLQAEQRLDKLANAVANAVDAILPDGAIRDVAAGVPLGHRLHPVLVTVPLGSWTAATVLDFTGGNARAAQRLVGLGVLAAVPTAATGARDYLDTSGPARRIGLVHAAVNDAALMAYGLSWLARRRGQRVRGAVLSLVGLGLAGTAGWLGGHMVYTLGAGVERPPAAITAG